MQISIDENAKQRFLWFTENHDNYAELKAQYPRFYDEILEMQEILKANANMLGYAEIALEKVLNNMFIDYMDESALSQLEEWLGITPTSSQTLDERKSVVASHFKGYGKISKSNIQQTADGYGLTAEVFFNERDENDNFLLRVKLYVPNDGTESDVYGCFNVLEIRLPAHLKRFYEFVFTATSSVGLAEISVINLGFSNECSEVDTDDIPELLNYDDEYTLLDSSENIMITEGDE